MTRSFNRVRALYKSKHEPSSLGAIAARLDKLSITAAKATRKQLRVLANCRTCTLADEQSLLAIRSLTFSIRVALTKAVRLLLNDYHSAGALSRKALELAYGLVTIAQKKANGVELLRVWARKHHAAGLQNLMPVLNNVDVPVDRSHIAGEIKKLTDKLPDGDISNITPAQLAKWAGLEVDHEMIYSRLNAYAHFDLFESFQQYTEAKERNPYVSACASAGRATVALAQQKVALYALMARRNLGQGGINEIVERNVAIQLDLSSKIEVLLGELGKYGAEIFHQSRSDVG